MAGPATDYVSPMELAVLTEAWEQVSTAVATHARWPPTGMAEALPGVAAGKVVKVRSGSGVAGVGLLAVSREAAWLAVTDDHPVDAVSGLTQVALRGAWGGDKLLYQRLDLPWPFQDRHWVLQSETNRALAGASPAWERAWRNAPESLPAARARTDAAGFDGALGVVENDGAWLLVPVGASATLAVYQARVDLGGSLPEGAAEAWSAATLDALFRSTTRDAASMTGRYGPGCTPQPGGDGRPIPCFPVPAPGVRD